MSVLLVIQYQVACGRFSRTTAEPRFTLSEKILVSCYWLDVPSVDFFLEFL